MKDEKTYSKIQTLVLDASILIKWIILETEGLEQIMQMKKDYFSGKIKIIIPSILFWEINNYLGRRFQPNEAGSRFSIILLQKFKEYPLDVPISHLAFEIMQSCEKVSFYDASYHALALNQNATYFTADEKYYQKAKKWKNIQLLKDY